MAFAWDSSGGGAVLVRRPARSDIVAYRLGPRGGVSPLGPPLLEPNADEREGYVPNVVYSCGAALHGRELVIPYAMSDYASTFATVPLDDVLNAMTRA